MLVYHGPEEELFTEHEDDEIPPDLARYGDLTSEEPIDLLEMWDNEQD